MTRDPGAAPAAPRRTITLERVLEGTPEEVWALWATKAGIEAWWGPDGFQVEVLELDLRTGGRMLYAMTAVAPHTVAFMKQAGMPLTTRTPVTFTEVSPPRRLAFDQLADFIPGVAPYEVATEVVLHPDPRGVRLVLTIDAMHDEVWTQRAVMGWESELSRLAEVLAR